MKNVFYLVVDALCYNSTVKKINNENIMPFLNNLKKKSLYFTNAYSQSPYTEASLVTILSQENTLDSGGYLFGNALVKNTIFNNFKKKGYVTISQYSPYVYSEPYLKGVDYYYYTRLINFDVLLLYRFDFFRKKMLKNTLTDTEIMICIELLNEEFYSWFKQIHSIINDNDESKIIKKWIDNKNIVSCYKDLKYEYLIFCNNKKQYILNLLKKNFHSSLSKINAKYNSKNDNLYNNFSNDEIKKQFLFFQKRYSEILKKDKLSFNYLFNVLSTSGIKNFLNLIHENNKYHNNFWLKDYCELKQKDKTEICMFEQFKHVINITSKIQKPVFVYMHVQDFHLPSIFHSIDSDDINLKNNEIKNALFFLSKIPNDYSGNIISDLSANYCDKKIEEFYNLLRTKYKDDFKLIITADHGFPAYYLPPRSSLGNQTYTEAFHIPLIIYDNIKKGRNEGYVSNKDIYDIICTNKIFKRDYILTEYAGPGCPMINQKPIWYTYIDKNYRISFEGLLNENITKKHIKHIFNLKDDPQEINDLVKNNKINIDNIIRIVNSRHIFLRDMYSNKKFDNIIFNKVILANEYEKIFN